MRIEAIDCWGDVLIDEPTLTLDSARRAAATILEHDQNVRRVYIVDESNGATIDTIDREDR